LEISVEVSYQIWVDVPRHSKEPFQQLFLQKNPHFHEFLLFQPVEGDKLWIVDHLPAYFMEVDGNRPASKLSAKKIDEDRALMKSL